MSHPYDSLTLQELHERRSMKWRKYPPDVLPVWVAETDFPLADPIRDVLNEMIAAGDTGYAWPGDVAEAYADFSLRRYGFEPDPGRSAVLQDIMRGILVALYELTPRGSGVAVPLPAYPPFFNIIEYAERTVVGIPMPRDVNGRYEIDLERLDATLSRADVCTFLLCNPHNPTGRVFGREELLAIAEIANRNGVVVLSDEVHGPLTYGEFEHVPYASLGAPATNSVSFVSASKAWNLPGLKCALAIASGPDTWKAFEALPTEIMVGASPLGIAANTAAFRDGVGWLDDTVDYLDGNRQALATLLAEKLPGIGYSMPEATYLAWLDCRALGLGADPSAVFLERGRVAVNPGPAYGTEAGSGFVRLNFGTSRAILTEAVTRMATAIVP